MQPAWRDSSNPRDDFILGDGDFSKQIIGHRGASVYPSGNGGQYLGYGIETGREVV